MKLKRLLLLSVVVSSLFIMNACSSGTVPSEMVGHWTLDKGDTIESYIDGNGFPISEMTIEEDGCVTLEMDYTYTGTIKEKGDVYEISIEQGGGTMSDMAAEDAKEAYKITADLNDGQLNVYIKANSGYYYTGSESGTFLKE